MADDKTITIKQVDHAVDCGIVVNPDGVQAQCEGGLVATGVRVRDLPFSAQGYG